MDIESTAGYEEALKYQNDPEAGDRALAVRFYTEEYEDEAATKKAGRPIFKTWECCEIRAPGSRDVKMGRIKYMQPDPRIRFAKAYAKFKAGQSVQVEGQLLKAWGLITPARAREYEALGVYTVEQLAAISDSNGQDIMGSLDDRQKAKDYLSMTKGLQPIAEARAEIAKLRSELQGLREQMQLAPKAEAAPKRRGRPPKVAPPPEN